MFDLNKDGTVMGNNGTCFDHLGIPRIPVHIRGKNKKWRKRNFIVDTGAPGMLIHIQEAEELGIDLDNPTSKSKVTGVAGIPIKSIEKRVLIRIEPFPPFFTNIRCILNDRTELRLLGRKELFPRFGIALNHKEIGIFQL